MVQIDVKSINYVSLLISYIELIADKSQTHKINTTNNLDLTVHRLLYLLFYKRKTKKVLLLMYEIIEIIHNTLVKIVKDRSYKRATKKPSTKFNMNGNRYKKWFAK